jgi:hypothetical protein
MMHLIYEDINCRKGTAEGDDQMGRPYGTYREKKTHIW